MLILHNGRNTVHGKTNREEQQLSNCRTWQWKRYPCYYLQHITMSIFYTNLGKAKMVPAILATLTAWLTCDIWAEWTKCDVAEALLPAMVVVMVVVVLGCGSDEVVVEVVVVVVEGGWWGELPRLARVAVRASSESCLSCWAPSEEGLEGGMRVRFNRAWRPLISLQLE